MLWCDETVPRVHLLDGHVSILPQLVHLRGNVPHKWIILSQKVIALMEEGELSSHEGHQLWQER